MFAPGRFRCIVVFSVALIAPAYRPAGMVRPLAEHPDDAGVVDPAGAPEPAAALGSEPDALDPAAFAPDAAALDPAALDPGWQAVRARMTTRPHKVAGRAARLRVRRADWSMRRNLRAAGNARVTPSNF
jgi:hypothetical protein